MALCDVWIKDDGLLFCSFRIYDLHRVLSQDSGGQCIFCIFHEKKDFKIIPINDDQYHHYVCLSMDMVLSAGYMVDGTGSNSSHCSCFVNGSGSGNSVQ